MFRSSPVREILFLKNIRFSLWRYLTAFSYISDVNRQVSWLSNPKDSLRINPNIKPDSIVDFDKTIAALSTFEKAALYQRVISNVRSNSLALTQQFDEMYMRKKSLNSYAMEWHRKFTLSFACLIFFFIGAPLGAIIRKGGAGHAGSCVHINVYSLLYFDDYRREILPGKGCLVNVVGGMWLASFVFLPLGNLVDLQGGNRFRRYEYRKLSGSF